MDVWCPECHKKCWKGDGIGWLWTLYRPRNFIELTHWNLCKQNFLGKGWNFLYFSSNLCSSCEILRCQEKCHIWHFPQRNWTSLQNHFNVPRQFFKEQIRWTLGVLLRWKRSQFRERPQLKLIKLVFIHSSIRQLIPQEIWWAFGSWECSDDGVMPKRWKG